jgi:enoyl-CoA hydratase/carnithine racemase
MTVTFNRPRRLNAIREQTLHELLAALHRAAEDDGVRVVVLTGAGRAFCAGQDLTELGERLAGGNHDEHAALTRLQDATRAVITHPKVVIAAINGVAVGFGAEISLAADIRVAARSASIGFVEVTRALAPTGGITWLLPRLIGHGRAADLLVSGEIVDARRCYGYGLVTRLFHDETFQQDVQDLAAAMAANAPISVALVRESLRRTWFEDFDAMLDLEVQGMRRCLTTQDLVEGTDAFLRGRAPEYTGR